MQTSSENIALLTSTEISKTVFILDDANYRVDGIDVHTENSGDDDKALDLGAGYGNLVFGKGRDTLLANIGCYPLRFR